MLTIRTECPPILRPFPAATTRPCAQPPVCPPATSDRIGPEGNNARVVSLDDDNDNWNDVGNDNQVLCVRP